MINCWLSYSACFSKIVRPSQSFCCMFAPYKTKSSAICNDVLEKIARCIG